ncbi:hypothetical protein [Halomonas sp.]|uniref:hypothetical protein n=1 Tax=Halomonas sp. TaxID=1486246 RepID=UPI003850EC37
MPQWVLAYDISEERVRRRCRRSLRAMAEGYQKSVFEIDAPTSIIREAAEELYQELAASDCLLATRVLPFGHAWQLGTGYRAPPGELIVIA